MAISIKSLADGQLPNAKTTLYTCPAVTTAIIRLITLVNTGAAARTVNLYLKVAAGTSRRLVPQNLSIAIGNVAIFDQVLTLEAGDVIEGDASVAAEVDYTIGGVEKTVGAAVGQINISAGTTSNNLLAVTFANAGGVSFGLDGSTVTAVAPAAAPNVSAGTTSNNLSAMVFSNSNRVSFGLNGSTITAQHALNFSAGTTSNDVSDQLVFSNSNNVSFGLNGSTVTATATFAGGGSLNLSAGTTSNNLTAVTFSNANGVSFGLDGSTVTASVNAGGGSINLSAGTTSNNMTAVTFSNANGVSFGLNGSVVTASVNTIPGGNGVTISSYQNVDGPLQTQQWATAVASLVVSHAVAFQLPNAGSFSFLRIPVIFTQSSVALTTAAASADMSVQRYWTFNAVVYSLGTGASSQSLQSVASGSAGWTILNSASIAANGTEGSYTQAMTYQHQGSSVTRSTQFSASSTVYPISSGFFTGFTQGRMLDINFATSLSAGPYWLIAGYSSDSSSNSARISGARTVGGYYSNHYAGSMLNVQFSEFNTTGLSVALLGGGSFSTAGGGTTASLNVSDISSTASNNKLFFQLLRSA